MSASGPIATNYYVESLLGPEQEELRFPGAPRAPALLPDCSDFPSCSFAPKGAVFGPGWPGGGPAVGYPHPHPHHPHAHPAYGPQPAEPPRYVRTWLEPLPGAAVPFPAFGARHFGLKADAFGARGRAEPPGGAGGTGGGVGAAAERGYPEVLYPTPGPLDADPAAGKHKEDKLDLDP
ncbi:hypothetical protein HGM15179_022123, partial [Zosterops borbonicus]